jgi:hypothetical protein
VSAIAWPGDLLKQVARRNVVLFVGAGVSMGSTNAAGQRPLGWKDLLRNLGNEICDASEMRTEVGPMIDRGEFLLAAEFIKYTATKTGNSNHYRDTIKRFCDGPDGDKFSPSELHNALMDLDPAIIVTTNFDKILERTAGEGYHALAFHETEIDNVVRQANNLILKLHGTVNHSARLVFTQSEYTLLRRDGALALEVLQSLLLTKMALFVGYSFNDPDLKLILETIFGVPGRGPGHVLVMNGKIPDFQQELFTGVYGLNVLSYPAGEHGELLDGIRELAAALA